VVRCIDIIQYSWLMLGWLMRRLPAVAVAVRCCYGLHWRQSDAPAPWLRDVYCIQLRHRDRHSRRVQHSVTVAWAVAAVYCNVLAVLWPLLGVWVMGHPTCTKCCHSSYQMFYFFGLSRYLPNLITIHNPHFNFILLMFYA